MTPRPLRLLAAGTAITIASAGAAHAQATGCWSCAIVLNAVATIQTTTTTFPAQLSAKLWPLFVLVVAFTLLWEMGKALITGANAAMPAIQTAIRMMVLAAILASPANIGQLASSYLVIPALAGGAGLGQTLATSGAAALGVSPPIADCTTYTPAAAGITDPDYAAAANSLLAIMCQVQSVTMVTFNIGAVIASQQLRHYTWGDARIAIMYNFIGLFMMYTALAMLLDFSLTLFEAIIRLGIVMVFIPFIAFFWVYPSLRGSVYRTFSNLLFVFVYLAMSGVASSVTAMLMLLGLRLGLATDGGAGTIQTPASAVLAFTQMLTAGATINDSATFGQAMRFIAYTTICTSLAMGIQRGIHGVAMQVTQYAGAGNGDRSMAIAAMSSLNSLAGIAMSGAAGTVVGLGRAAGQFVGKRGLRRTT